MLTEDSEEALAVCRLDQMDHFVEDHVFKQIFWLGYKLCVQANVSRLVIAAPPLSFHPLQEIPLDTHSHLQFPFRYEGRHDLM